MTDPETYTPTSPFLTTLVSNDGLIWQFAYWGTGFVYIREVIDGENEQPVMGTRASRDDWPYLIDLNSYSMQPGDVTRRWLADQSAQWIIARNDDLRKGNL